jgi:hypothetical protein
MRVIDMLSVSNYLTMLEKSELIQTKKSIKEAYLQNILSVDKNITSFAVDKDPIAQAYFKGELSETMRKWDSLPGFEKAPKGIIKLDSKRRISKVKPLNSDRSVQKKTKSNEKSSIDPTNSDRASKTVELTSSGNPSKRGS